MISKGESDNVGVKKGGLKKMIETMGRFFEMKAIPIMWNRKSMILLVFKDMTTFER